jgi:hypothetical protein
MMSRHDSEAGDRRDERDDRDDREDRRPERRGRDDRDSDDRDERSRRPLHRERGVVLFADQSGSIIRAGDEALEEDLPVLNAFRQFLDAERRRARRQMIIMITVFTVILVGMAVGGTWFVRKALSRMETGIESDKVRFEEDRLATVSNLQTVAKVAVSLKKDVLDTRTTSSVLQEKVKKQSGELDKLLDTISTLEIQNSTLQRAMRLLDKAMEPSYERPEPVIREQGPRQPFAEPVSRRPEPAIAPAPAAEIYPAPVARIPGDPSGRAPETVSDLTPGGVPFRLPLPKD